jgi:hypothetical protein
MTAECQNIVKNANLTKSIAAFAPLLALWSKNGGNARFINKVSRDFWICLALF